VLKLTATKGLRRDPMTRPLKARARQYEHESNANPADGSTRLAARGLRACHRGPCRLRSGWFGCTPPRARSRSAPHLVCASITDWQPPQRFDLITCVHGLQYVGDKLSMLASAASWLTGTGIFVADLGLASIRLAHGQPAGLRLITALRGAGFTYDSRRHRITRTGPGDIDLPYRYLGADNQAGPNYTGQPAVNSIYAER
jgi:hypothetical protein